MDFRNSLNFNFVLDFVLGLLFFFPLLKGSVDFIKLPKE